MSGASRHPALMVNYPTFSFMPWPYQSINGLLPLRSRWCAGHEVLWSRERCLCLEKKVDLKCMQLNALKNIARMTRRLSILTMSLRILEWICTLYFKWLRLAALCSCLNIKELRAQSRRDTWSLSDCNGIRTHNHVIRKRTHNHSAKLARWLNFAK